MKKKHYILISIFLVNLIVIKSSRAQLNPLGTQYYANEYLINPAMAGMEKGITLQSTYRKLWSGIPGSPETQSLTIDYGVDRLGWGIHVNNESAGLLRETRVVGSYAYHLPLDSGRHQLHFGVSLGMMSKRLESSDINADPNDPGVGEYNNRRRYWDGDFGISYTSERLDIQAAIPNLNDFFNRDMANVSDLVTFYSAISYRIDLNGSIGVKPKVAFRGVRNYKNMIDLGMQFSLAEGKVTAMGLYHSNESATLGLGLNILNWFAVSGMYTTETAALNSYMNGSFELNLKLRLKK